MGIIVQKYGGTSLGSGERLLNVAGIIQATRATNPVVAVVSAMSGTTKEAGTTSLLLTAATEAAAGRDFEPHLDNVERHHMTAISEAVETPNLRDELTRFVHEELSRRRTFLEAIQVIRELSPRSQDILMATGERLSARLLTGVLQDRQVPADFVDLSGIVPDDDDLVVGNQFFRDLQDKLAEIARPGPQRVPIVTGFFGLVPGGLLHEVGRGYTDFTAALISAGLGKEQADEMQVWKEVDGIFTADPRKVPAARVLPRISPVEASELTYFGSEVLHPFTMERVVAAEIPIRIKNTFNPEGPGTVIRPGWEPEQARVAAVTAKRGVTVFTVESNRMYDAHGFMARVFNVLEQHEVVVDLIATSEVSISCTVDSDEEITRARADLEELGEVHIIPGRAILAAVGEGMKYAAGTAGKMFTALGADGVNIEVISQGASEINISCVVREEDAEKGLRSIHRAFLEAE